MLCILLCLALFMSRLGKKLEPLVEELNMYNTMGDAMVVTQARCEV